MKDVNLPKPLRGIIVPMVTPLSSVDTLDIDGLERLIEHIIAGGVHSIFVLGTTGEGPDLSYKLRCELIKRTCTQVKDRVPVLVGITDTSFMGSIEIAQKSADCGAKGLVLAPPYYAAMGQAELLEYIQHLVPKLPLPMFLYNMPSHTKVTFEPDTVKAISELEGVVGLKDSSSNMIYFHILQGLFKDRPDFSLLVGPEELLAETVLLGGHGGVSGGANVFPKLYVDLYNAAAKGDVKTALPLHQKVMQISTKIYNVGKYTSRVIKGIKCSLSLMEICDDFMAEPFHRFRDPERAKIQQYLEEFGVKK